MKKNKSKDVQYTFDKFEEKTKDIYFPVFDYHIIVIFTTNMEKSANKVLDEHKLVGKFVPNAVGLTISPPHAARSYVIAPYKTCIDTIVHECFHAVCRMFRWVHASSEEEIVAYHLDYTTGQAVRLYNNKVRPVLDELESKNKSLENTKKSIDKTIRK